MNPDPTAATPDPSEPSRAESALDEGALLDAARGVLEHAHSPYSEVRVGAALLDDAGRVHLGCNVENASYGLTVCAERGAVQSAVAAGVTSFAAIAIATNREQRLPPCGACRQVLAEFAPGLRVLSVGTDGVVSSWSLSELMPAAFLAGDLD